jgi:hypothetical protein
MNARSGALSVSLGWVYLGHVLCLGCCSRPATTGIVSTRDPSSITSSKTRSTEQDPLRTHSELGREFPSAEDFAARQYQGYPNDPSIVIAPIENTPLVWVKDKTPRINGTWHLLARTPSGSVRYVLCHPTAEWVAAEPSSLNDQIEFVEIWQPRPASNHITYGYDSPRGYFRPQICSTQVTYTNECNGESTSKVGQAEGVISVEWTCSQRPPTCD